jgi:UDP-N-acetylglucosamine--N-acetylmuramyl-(pentapeptide) pyrophosphoryl-undecaprenol N-acetylglucosamine transferase
MTEKAKKLIIFVGGGSGGHLTPMIPIAESLKEKDPSINIIHIGQRGDHLNYLTDNPAIDKRYTVSAGKLRRYHGESWRVRLLDVKTLFFNVRDFFRFMKGIVQAWHLLGSLRPDAIFMKGGYVCAPVGIAAGLRHIPYVTHDSDAMVSLAHRLIAKKALYHLTAMEPKLYLPHYEVNKTFQVGVPVRSEYEYVTSEIRTLARQKLGFSNSDKVLLVVGGGLGSRNINNAILKSVSGLLSDNINVVLVTGHKLYNEVTEMLNGFGLQEGEKERIRVVPFTDELHTYSASADVIVSRAGATNIAEFAAQGKACIVVPSPFLAGGHQLKNAQALRDSGAVEIVEEQNIGTLSLAVRNLFNDAARQEHLREKLHSIAQLDAAELIADKILLAAGLEA